jgi:DNA-binding NtrC family response regulator
LISDGADDNNELAEKLKPVFGPDIVKMPTMPEVLESAFKYFYTFSPELREATRLVGELAENNYSRLYLLGAPGTGKTSLAYYFWLKRNKGRFVVVNLTAESTTDKASMKSLLCGHVSGAFPGSGAREGALSFAQQGVCFLDESHGVSGVVMQVLMEVLDSGQFMPFGAVAKRELQCAVVFASNRSWDTLTKNINLDEHARIGATIIELADLAQRKEDLIAVVATTLNRLKKQFTTWQAPLGLTKSAWELYANSPWYGNTRALIRVTETAATNFAQEHSKDPTIGKLIDVRHVTPALAQWEPSSHESLKLYSSTSRQIND